uniref:Uncharacterized protein n=1 Tax=Anguilla anguilla TaxID=7936 RepID=A0A0E9R0G0_ANGAN
MIQKETSTKHLHQTLVRIQVILYQKIK